jgi:hypothetical protein
MDPKPLLAGGDQTVGDDRYFHDIADLADRRATLLNDAANTLQRLLAEIGSPVSGCFAALGESPLTYSVSVELALHQLRRQIVMAGRPDWASQLNQLSSASRAIRRAAELAQQSVTVEVGESSNRHPE